ncbi:MAG: intradiol ring-cleavage dioxygenase [Pirellulales bacterium]
MSLFAPGVFAEQLAATPDMTEGPFYPTRLPLDRDNDLILLKDSTTPAIGEITHLGGRILDSRGNPLKDVEIQIWQCDAKEVYHLTRDEDQNADRMDKNFQGFGRFVTDSTGEYRFRTIKPVPYPGRPAGHIHFKVLQNDRELLTSQIFVAGAPGNARDGVFRSLRDPFERELIQTEFTPLKGSKIGELVAKFDIVVGRTPADPEQRG